MDVICDSCRQSYHTTTDEFDPSRPANGIAFRLKKKYRDAGWSSFGETPDYEYGTLECPGCGACYGNGSGFVTTRDEEGNIIEALEYQSRYDAGIPIQKEAPTLEFSCVVPGCDRKFKSNAGLASHMRSHR